MRLIVGKERPHPGAQLRFTDIDGNRHTCFATNTPLDEPREPALHALSRSGRTAAAATAVLLLARVVGLMDVPSFKRGWTASLA